MKPSNSSPALYHPLSPSKNMKNEIYKRQFTVGEIMSVSWQYFIKNWQLIFLISLAVYVPLNIILALVPMESLIDSHGFWTAFRIYFRIIELLEFLIGIIAIMAITLVIKAKIDNKTIDFKQAMIQSLKKWPQAIGTNILAGIFLIGLFLLLFVPGIIFYIYWIFITYVVILKNIWGYSAIKESKAIVQNRWWKTFGIALLFGILTIIVGIIVGGVLGYIIPDHFVTNIITDTIIDLSLAFFSVLWIVLFINYDSNRIKKVSEQTKQ